MANDVIFKSKAFGGFDKNEVMDFVDKMLEEKVNLEKKLSESNSKLAQVNAELFEFKKSAEEASDLKLKLEEAEKQISQLQTEISEKTGVEEALQTQLFEKSAEITKLQEENSSLSTPWERQRELDELKAEVARLKVEAEKKRDIERQVGAAMLDARIHSEELVEQAKEKASAVTKSVYSAIGDTALKIDDLSSGIAEIARNFTKAVEEVELRIKALTGDMSKTAQLLISESGSITDSVDVESQVEYDFSSADNYSVENVNTVEFNESQD